MRIKWEFHPKQDHGKGETMSCKTDENPLIISRFNEKNLIMFEWKGFEHVSKNNLGI